MKKAAKECVLGAFLNSGQICMSTERILVHKTISASFAEEVKAVMAEMHPPGGKGKIMINEGAVAKNTRMLQDAHEKGAEFLVGGIAAEKEPGSQMQPFIVKGVTKDMAMFYTESFGPSVSSIEFDGEIEAVKIANDTEYGLTAAVFTRDVARGLSDCKID